MNQLKIGVTQNLDSGDSVELTYLDIILWVREDGGTWKKADPANFPAGGITVLIPYSELSTTYEQAQHINFSVAHMFAVTANGNTAGNIETPTCNVTANGLQFTVAGLSPIAVGRSAKSLITYNANGGSCDTASAYAEGNGKLSNLPTPAKSGSYRFDGWFTAAVGGTAVTADTVFAEDTTVYAHWTYTGSGDNEDSSSDEDSSSSSDDGDSSYSYYTITATAGEGGTISTDKTVSVREGNNASFTFTPNNGYQIADVLVNGKSVGAVKTFTFTNVRSNQTIHVTFKASTGHVNSQTGDTGNMSLWIALLFISGGLLTTIGINKKRKNTTNK